MGAGNWYPNKSRFEGDSQDYLEFFYFHLPDEGEFLDEDGKTVRRELDEEDVRDMMESVDYVIRDVMGDDPEVTTPFREVSVADVEFQRDVFGSHVWSAYIAEADGLCAWRTNWYGTSLIVLGSMKIYELWREQHESGRDCSKRIKRAGDKLGVLLDRKRRAIVKRLAALGIECSYRTSAWTSYPHKVDPHLPDVPDQLRGRNVWDMALRETGYGRALKWLESLRGQEGIVFQEERSPARILTAGGSVIATFEEPTPGQKLLRLHI